MAAAEPPKSKGQSKLRTQLNEEDLRRAYQAAKKVADEHDVKGMVNFNLRAYSRLMGYGWAAFFGAAGFALLLKYTVVGERDSSAKR